MEKNQQFELIQRQIVLDQSSLYSVGENEYFKFTLPTLNCNVLNDVVINNDVMNNNILFKTFRDVPCDLAKIDKYTLEVIYKYCTGGKPTYKLKKNDLLQFIHENNCIVFPN